MALKAYMHRTGAKKLYFVASAAIAAGTPALRAGKAVLPPLNYAIGDNVVADFQGEITGVFVGSEPAGNAGDPVYYDSSAGGFSLFPQTDSGDFYAGILSADMDAAATEGYILLNEVNQEVPAELLAGKDIAVKTANYTVVTQDVGRVLGVNLADQVTTLLATKAGMESVVVNMAADGNGFSVSPAAADNITGAGITGVDNKDWVNTPATAKRWDYLHLVATPDGWLVKAKRGIWAQEA